MLNQHTSCIDETESQWGTLVLTVAARNETNEKKSRDKFIACVFLAGVDTKKVWKVENKIE
jgi:hypothetical protein